MPVIGGLENMANENDTDLEASYDPGLVAVTAGPSYPIARASLTSRFSENQPTALTHLPSLPLAKRPRGRAVPVTPMATAAPPPAESPSLVNVLERINEEKAKQIEKLEAKIEKLEEKLEKLDDRNRKLESRSRVLELQLMARKDVTGRATGGGGGGSGGSGGGKRKRGGSTDIASLAQLEEGDDDGDDDGDGEAV